MTRRSPLLLLAALCAVVLVLPAVSTAAAPSYRPDGVIKLCGLSTGCKVGPKPPHPWRGNGIYNSTARKQTVAVRMEDGEGSRFWINFENDGSESDKLVVQGCRGNRYFKVNKVQLGKHKRPDWKAVKVTKQFVHGTLKFDLAPKAAGVITLNILAPTTKEGVTYRCPVTVSSTNDPSLKDTVAAVITTY